MKLRKLMTGIVFFVLCALMFSMSVSAAETMLKNKKWVSGKCGVFVDEDEDGLRETFRENDPAYFKIKAPGNGTIVVEAKVSKIPGTDEANLYWKEFEEGEIDGDHLEIAVLDSQKNGILGHWFSYKKKYNFSQIVKKNAVYYLGLTGDCKYKIRYTYFPAPKKISKPAHKIRKAKLLKKGMIVNSFLDVDVKKGMEGIKEDCYKLEIKKQTNVTLSFDTQICESGKCLQVLLYVKKGKEYELADEKGKIQKDTLLWWEVGKKDKVTFKLPKGTYVVRLYSFEGTGYYSMKWK